MQTIAFTRSRRGYKLNHKGEWLELTGYYNSGYWQGINQNNTIKWVKNGLKCISPDYQVNI